MINGAKAEHNQSFTGARNLIIEITATHYLSYLQAVLLRL